MENKYVVFAVVLIACSILSGVIITYRFVDLRLMELTGFTQKTWIVIRQTTGNSYTNVPIKIQLNSTTPYFSFAKIYSSYAYDVRFADESDVIYKHYTEYFNKATQKAIFWVQIPSLLSGQNKVVVMYSYKTDATTDPSTLSVFSDGGYTQLQQDFEGVAADTAPSGWTGNNNGVWKTTTTYSVQGSMNSRWYDYVTAGEIVEKVMSWHSQDAVKFLIRIQKNSYGTTSRYFMFDFLNGVANKGLSLVFYINDPIVGTGNFRNIISVRDVDTTPKTSGTIEYDGIWYSVNLYLDWVLGQYHLEVCQLDTIQRTVFSCYGTMFSTTYSKIAMSSPPSSNAEIYVDAVSDYQYMYPKATVNTELSPEYNVVFLNYQNMMFPALTSVTLDVKVSYGSTPMSGASLSVKIPAKQPTYLGLDMTVGADGSGIASIPFTTPPSDSLPYTMNITILVSSPKVFLFQIQIQKGISISYTNLPIEEYYSVTGDYDLSVSGKLEEIETPGSPLSQPFTLTQSVVGPEGSTIESARIVESNLFTVKAKVYAKYSTFDIRRINITITVSKTGYVTTSSTVSIQMTTPKVISGIGFSSTIIPINTQKITITFIDGSTHLPATFLLQSNVVVIIRTPSQTSVSTDNMPTEKLYWSSTSSAVKLIIDYTFDKLGTYTVEVSYRNLQYTVAPQVHYIDVYEEGSFINTTTIGVVLFVLAIVVIMIIRRKKHAQTPT